MNKQVLSMIGLAAFAMMQISACFVAGMKTDGFLSFFFFAVGGISCLFGLALNFLLLVIGVNVFGSIYASLAAKVSSKEQEDDDDDDEDQAVIEVVNGPEE